MHDFSRAPAALAVPTAPAEPNDTLLLCVDLQPIFLAGIPDKPLIVSRCAFAIAAAAGLGLPVLFTEQIPEKLGPTAPELLAVVTKSKALGKDAFSAFGDETIAALIRAQGTRQLLLCGIETPICVYQSARDALQAGYAVTVLSDCVGGRRPADGTAALAHLAALGCRVLPAETVFYALLKHARHPFFRDYTALVKKYA